MTETWYTEQQVADLFQTTKRVIASARRNNEIVGTKVGKEFRYSKTAIDDYIDHCNRKGQEVNA